MDKALYWLLYPCDFGPYSDLFWEDEEGLRDLSRNPWDEGAPPPLQSLSNLFEMFEIESSLELFFLE